MNTETRYNYRLADENDIEAIAEMFRSHNYGLKEVEWVRWKYFNNPDGNTNVFIGEDSNGEMVALRAHMPRYFTSRETGKFFLRHSVDMFVDKAHRGNGVYSAVWRLCRSGSYPIIGFPSKIAKQLTTNMPGDVRVYHKVDEWWYPVTIGNFTKDKLPILASAAETLSRFYSSVWLGGSPKNLKMKPIERFEKSYSFEPEFIQGVRSAEFLNWRFVDNPIRSYARHEFFDSENESSGYCVYRVDDSVAKIYDLVLNRHARGCLRLLVDHLRDRQVSHIIFKSIGFRMGKYGFIKTGSPGDMDTLNTPQGKWKVTFADKD